MIVSKYFRIDGKDYVEASDYDKILYELKHKNDEILRKETEINQIDNVLNELFGVKHDIIERPDEFKEILKEKAKENFENKNSKAVKDILNENIDLRKQVTELEMELDVKDNLLKIKNGLCGDNNYDFKIKVALKQLQIIHTENMLILATLTDKDIDDKCIKKMDKMFEDTWGNGRMNNKCNFSTCRYNENGICQNDEKRKECINVSKAVLCLEENENEKIKNRN